MSREHVQVQILFEDIVYHIFFDIVDLKFAKFDTLEEGKKIDIKKGYYCYKHPPHIPSGKTHYEVYYKKNKLFALNIDGTSHDGSSGQRIPNVVYDFFVNMGIPLSSDQIIETIDYEIFFKTEQCMDYMLLKESCHEQESVDTIAFFEICEDEQ